MVGTFRSGGRNSKPAWRKELEGNPGKRRIPTPMDARGALPPPPKHFTREQVTLWNEIVFALPPGVLTAADQNVVERAAVAWAQYREASRQLRKAASLVAKKPSGIEYKNPWLQVRTDAAKELAMCSAELGLSPQARTRIGAQPQPSDDFMEMLMGGDDKVWNFAMEPEEDKAN